MFQDLLSLFHNPEIRDKLYDLDSWNQAVIEECDNTIYTANDKLYQYALMTKSLDLIGTVEENLELGLDYLKTGDYPEKRDDVGMEGNGDNVNDWRMGREESMHPPRSGSPLMEQIYKNHPRKDLVLGDQIEDQDVDMGEADEAEMNGPDDRSIDLGNNNDYHSLAQHLDGNEQDEYDTHVNDEEVNERNTNSVNLINSILTSQHNYNHNGDIVLENGDVRFQTESEITDSSEDERIRQRVEKSKKILS